MQTAVGSVLRLMFSEPKLLDAAAANYSLTADWGGGRAGGHSEQQFGHGAPG